MISKLVFLSLSVSHIMLMVFLIQYKIDNSKVEREGLNAGSIRSMIMNRPLYITL